VCFPVRRRAAASLAAANVNPRINTVASVNAGKRRLGVIGFNFGMGLALNEKASLSLGYEHSSITRMRQNGVTVPGSVRTQLGTLLVAYSYRLSEKRTLNVSIGAGVTHDTPDVSLTVRLPLSF
jgi:hypothetical protein